MKLYLIRHAESANNVDKREARAGSLLAVLRLLRFDMDSPLSPSGRESLVSKRLELRDFLQANHITLVLHSPLVRARDTCLGLFPNHATEMHPNLYEKSLLEYAMTGRLRGRVDGFLSDVRARGHENVAVVGHGKFFAQLVARNKLKMANLEVVEFAC